MTLSMSRHPTSNPGVTKWAFTVCGPMWSSRSHQPFQRQQSIYERALFYRPEELLVLDLQQCQQLLISAIKRCPPHLRLDKNSLLLQFLPFHWRLPTRAISCV
jgi:hypothetical protein